MDPRRYIIDHTEEFIVVSPSSSPKPGSPQSFRAPFSQHGVVRNHTTSPNVVMIPFYSSTNGQGIRYSHTQPPYAAQSPRFAPQTNIKQSSGFVPHTHIGQSSGFVPQSNVGQFSGFPPQTYDEHSQGSDPQPDQRHERYYSADFNTQEPYHAPSTSWSQQPHQSHYAGATVPSDAGQFSGNREKDIWAQHRGHSPPSSLSSMQPKLNKYKPIQHKMANSIQSPPSSSRNLQKLTKNIDETNALDQINIRGKAPRAPHSMPGVICYICGKNYGSASIEIHEKTCLAKWKEENNARPKHMKRPEPIKPFDNPVSSSPMSGSPMGKYNLGAFNDKAFKLAQGQLVPCAMCGRTFQPDRLEIHRRNCRGGVYEK